MRNFRFILALGLAFGLAPGTLVRTEPVRDYRSSVEIKKLARFEGLQAGPLILERVWEIRSENDLVGGYSALMQTGENGLVAGSDAGRLLFMRRENGEIVDAVPEKFVHSLDRDKTSADIESLTRDPRTGDFWVGYENTNAIQRYSADYRPERQSFPRKMAHWADNSGPEAMTRLSDGRFLIIAEGTTDQPDREGHEALLFTGDPTRNDADPVDFFFAGLGGYRPVDAANLPDGRVLVLMRRWTFALPPKFQAAIMLADPADIVPGEQWTGELVARLDSPFPTDNFEGLAVEQQSGRDLRLWIVSDDNFMQHQRTLLLRLRWQRQKARK